MKPQIFIEIFRQAMGPRPHLPIAFWYDDNPVREPERVNGCFFKAAAQMLEGIPFAFNAETITCGGGKFYTGFSDMPERVPNFVSLTERYKETPQMVLDFIGEMKVRRAEKQYLNFARVDKIDSFDKVEVLIFFASPDVLAGLTTWAWFDNNSFDGVSTIFGSGCSATVTLAANENRAGGRRTFLGGFDPSVRSHFDADMLTFTVPMSRMREMFATLRHSCLFDNHAWKKVRERIDG